MGDRKVIGSLAQPEHKAVAWSARSSAMRPRLLSSRPDARRARTKGAAPVESGADVVTADLDDAAGVRRAFTGALPPFCVTNYWEHFSPEREVAGPARWPLRRHTAQHLIWSTLEDTRDAGWLWTTIACRRSWGAMQFRISTARVRRITCSSTPASDDVPDDVVLWDNLIHFGMGPRRGEDERLSITFPMATRNCLASPSRTSADRPTRSSKRGDAFIGRPLELPASI